MNILSQFSLFNFLSEHDLLDRDMSLLEQEIAYEVYTELADLEDGDPRAAAEYIRRVQDHRPKRGEERAAATEAGHAASPTGGLTEVHR
ncbi:hypothetical protein [Mesorhizobium australicum]|uniref:hypothetical protein n=1 Tax=Mesorhizobium australicum TaxID=536018 RepID=UPI003337F809